VSWWRIVEQWRVVDRWWTAEPVVREFREVEDRGERYVEQLTAGVWRRVERQA